MLRTLALLPLLGGCFLPVATGASMPATTVGRHRVGAAISGEAPTIDLIANTDDPGANDYADTYGQSPAAAMNFTVSYGLTDDTDLEVAAEGELWFFFLPIPTGGSVGLRHHLGASDLFDFAIAGRIGGVSSGAATTDSSGNSVSDEASALYGALQGVVQLRHGVVRPLLALNLMPFKITRAPEGDPIQHFAGLASSLTFGLMFTTRHVTFGPYITATDYASDHFDGGVFGSGGLMFAIRPDRDRRPPAPPAPAPMAPAPAPMAAPAPAPAPMAAPAPMPAPAPAPMPAPAPAPVSP